MALLFQSGSYNIYIIYIIYYIYIINNNNNNNNNIYIQIRQDHSPAPFATPSPPLLLSTTNVVSVCNSAAFTIIPKVFFFLCEAVFTKKKVLQQKFSNKINQVLFFLFCFFFIVCLFVCLFLDHKFNEFNFCNVC